MSATSDSDTPRSEDAPAAAARWWDRPGVRLALLAVLGVILIEGAAIFLHLRREDGRPPQSVPPSRSEPAYLDELCAGVAYHDGVHGTDCKSMPILTAPGALGPANTGGPAGGTDWEPAYPGSNVWIPEFQISGRLVVFPAGTTRPPPAGYERLGMTPDGATLYWRPSDHPDNQSTGGKR